MQQHVWPPALRGWADGRVRKGFLENTTPKVAGSRWRRDCGHQEEVHCGRGPGTEHALCSSAMWVCMVSVPCAGDMMGKRRRPGQGQGHYRASVLGGA